MSNIEDHQAGRVRHYGALKGTVVDNADDQGLHRVKILIPAIAEPSTDWAFPLTAGGGSPQRGGHIVPAVGADVVCWFDQGDPQGACFYACGWWGIPDAGTEVPGDIKDGAANAHQIQTLQIGLLLITLDERDGSKKLVFTDTKSGDHILWDLEKQGLELVFSRSITLKALGLLALEAAQLTLNNRIVLSKPSAI